MRGKVRIFVPLLSMSLVGLLGCRELEPTFPAGKGSGTVRVEEIEKRERAFETDMLALKARETDPARLDAAARELVAKHGFADRGEFQGSPAGLKLPGHGEHGPVEFPMGKPLAKMAAADQFFLVKDYTDPISGTFSTVIRLPANGTLTVETKRQGSTDPALIVYYVTTGIDSAFAMNIVALVDDNVGLDAKASWRNATGSVREIYIVAFSPTSATVGTADVMIKVASDPAQTLTTVPVAGRVYGEDNLNPNPGFSCPIQSESRVSGTIQDFANVRQSIIMVGVNGLTRTGVHIQFGPTKSGVTKPLGEGKMGFLLVYQPMWYSGIPLIEGSARVTQENGYDCF